uniref:Uncharacterized protein n=1 Tax=Globisporangium ultimum (strain ATCC 200006 / CBS 805.95 / DAOM BR144) TaxID=431595 RepID=K3WJP9_GLOUD
MSNRVDLNIGKVVLNPSTKMLLMDIATISSLELIQSVRGDSTRQMLQPTRHLKTIRSRQEVVEVFLGNPGWFFDIMEQLPSYADLDRLLLVVVPKFITPRVSRIAIGNVIALKQMLGSLPALVSQLEAMMDALEKPCALITSITQ